MYMKKILKISVALSMLAPLLAGAQSTFSGLDSAITSIANLINRLVPLVIGLAVLFFLWAILRFVGSAGDEEKRKEARGLIIWGIVAIFVMVSVWGLVNILRNTFNLDTTNVPPPPTPVVPGSAVTP